MLELQTRSSHWFTHIVLGDELNTVSKDRISGSPCSWDAFFEDFMARTQEDSGLGIGIHINCHKSEKGKQLYTICLQSKVTKHIFITFYYF